MYQQVVKNCLIRRVAERDNISVQTQYIKHTKSSHQDRIKQGKGMTRQQLKPTNNKKGPANNKESLATIDTATAPLLSK